MLFYIYFKIYKFLINFNYIYIFIFHSIIKYEKKNIFLIFLFS